MKFIRTFIIVHFSVHKYRNMLKRILKDPEYFITFEILYRSPEPLASVLSGRTTKDQTLSFFQNLDTNIGDNVLF